MAIRSKRNWLTLATLVLCGLGCAKGASDGDPAETAETARATSAGGEGGGPGGASGSGAAGGGEGGEGGDGGAGGAAPGCLPFDGTVLAMDELLLGDRDFLGSKSATAWRGLGFDIDGLQTSTSLEGHCMPQSGGSTATVGDGEGGIDNAFGRHILPMLLSLDPALADTATSAVTYGQFTLLLMLEQLGPGPDQAPLTSRLAGGAPLGALPGWKGDDCWPVVREDLVDPFDILTAKTVFPQSELVDNQWSSVGTTTLVIPINWNFYTVPITIHHARLTTTLSPTHQGAALGHIGGVLDTEELVEAVRGVIGHFSPTLCQGSTFASVASAIRKASDIMKDGSQNPAAVCDGISVGLGFSMLAAGLGAIAPPAVAPADGCG